MAYTQLSPSAIPGKRYSFSAATARLGVILDPDIESLTAVRKLTSQTFVRILTSLTSKRKIEAA